MKCGGIKEVDASRCLTRREFLIALAGSTALAAAPAFAEETIKDYWHERTKPLMATYVSIAIMHTSRKAALDLIGECFQNMESQIAILSSWDPDSYISRLNDGRSMGTPPECVRRMAASSAFAERLTKGRFHLLIGQLTHLWREAKAASVRPEKLDIKYALKLIAGSRIDSSESFTALHGAGRIDVGGIGKGLLADLACEYLSSRGVRSARVACSGDLRFLGNGPWKVEIQNPNETEPRTVSLAGSLGISTSGISENSWEYRGEEYHHLIDPFLGYPGR